MIDDSRCFIIAEIGINHEGSAEICARMIRAAAEAGADAIKLQTVDADVSYDSASPSHALFKASVLSREETAAAFRLARELGMAAFTTAADPQTIDWIDRLGPDAHKVSSGLLTTTPVVRHLAAKGRQLIMSTGMATEADIDEAMDAARGAGAVDLTLLHCVSVYPAPPESLNLSTIPWLAQRWQVRSGFSDHSAGNEAAPLAVAFGARVLEKHFSLDPSRPGFDHRLSLDPVGFGVMIDKVRRAEVMAGRPGRHMEEAELAIRRWAHRVVVTARDLPAGAAIDAAAITYKRPPPDTPAGGLRPATLDRLMRMRLRQALSAGTVLRAEHVEGWTEEDDTGGDDHE